MNKILHERSAVLVRSWRFEKNHRRIWAAMHLGDGGMQECYVASILLVHPCITPSTLVIKPRPLAKLNASSLNANSPTRLLTHICIYPWPRIDVCVVSLAEPILRPFLDWIGDAGDAERELHVWWKRKRKEKRVYNSFESILELCDEAYTHYI